MTNTEQKVHFRKKKYIRKNKTRTYNTTIHVYRTIEYLRTSKKTKIQKEELIYVGQEKEKIQLFKQTNIYLIIIFLKTF